MDQERGRTSMNSAEVYTIHGRNEYKLDVIIEQKTSILTKTHAIIAPTS
jgi:precorrin-6B methylase 1